MKKLRQSSSKNFNIGPSSILSPRLSKSLPDLQPIRRIVFAGTKEVDVGRVLLSIRTEKNGFSFNGSFLYGNEVIKTTGNYPSQCTCANDEEQVVHISNQIKDGKDSAVDVVIFAFYSYDRTSASKWCKLINDILPSAIIVLLVIAPESKRKRRDDSDSQSSSEEVKLITFQQGVQLCGLVGAAHIGFCDPNEPDGDIQKIKLFWEQVHRLLQIRDRHNNSTKVELTGKELIVFPGFLGSEKITHVDLSDNGIYDFGCRQIHQNKFFNLEKLIIRNNNLTALPVMISRLKRLTYVDFSNNKLLSLPSVLGECESLTTIIVRNNQIESLPFTLGHLNKLHYIDVRDNPLSFILPELIPDESIYNNCRYLHKLKAYFSALEQGKPQEFSRVKLMFVGDANVGKTSLLNYMQHNKPMQQQYNVATDGIDLTEVALDGCTFDCYDFAGQELYYTTHQFFLSTKAIYLLVFNMLEPNYNNLTYWLKSIRMKARHAPIVLVGTHAESCKEDYKDELIEKIKRKYKTFQIHQEIFSVSNITKDKSVKILKENLVEIATKRKFIGGQIPSSYVYLMNKIIMLKKNNPFMKLSEFVPYIDSYNIPSNQQSQAFEIMHDLGYVLYYKADAQLKDMIILDPQFLSDLMKTIVSMKNQWARNGCISNSNINQILSSYPEELHVKFLRLLSQFEVIYQLPSTDWIVPCMLPANPPEDFSNFDLNHAPQNKTIAIRLYKFAFMPFGFISRLTTRIMGLPKVTIKELWKNGFLMESGDQIGAINYDPDNYNLTLSVLTPKGTFPEKNNLFIDSLESIDSLISIYYAGKKNDIKILIPYKGNKKNPVDVSYTYNDIVMAGVSGLSEVTQHEITVPLKHIAPDIARLQEYSIKNVKKIAKIGQGAFGVVYKGEMELNKKKVEVAIKELLISNIEKDLDGFNEFMHEVNIMRHFDSPYLVKLYGTTFNPLSMVMEFCPGKSLDKILYDKKSFTCEQLPWKLKLKIALDIANGIKALHAHRPAVMHRDLRSPNVFISSLELKEGVVNAKVGDFGLAQYTLPNLSEMLGCWQWLGPEVFDPNSPSYDEKSDVYSFGVVMWELAAREVPFSEFNEYIDTLTEPLTDEQLSDKQFIRSLETAGYSVVGSNAVKEQYRVHDIKEAIIERDLRPSIPSTCLTSLAELITCCWQNNPVDRPSVDELITELTQMLENETCFNDTVVSPAVSVLKKSFANSYVKTYEKLSDVEHMLENKVMIKDEPVSIRVKSIKLENINFPSSYYSSRVKGLYFRVKFRNQLWKTKTFPVKIAEGNKVEVDWEISGSSQSVFSIDLVVKYKFIQSVEAKCFINVFCNLATTSNTSDIFQSTLIPISKTKKEKPGRVSDINISLELKPRSLVKN